MNLKEMDKEEAIQILQEHERNGTLARFLSQVAPEYVTHGYPLVFTLITDMGWWE